MESVLASGRIKLKQSQSSLPMCNKAISRLVTISKSPFVNKGLHA